MSFKFLFIVTIVFSGPLSASARILIDESSQMTSIRQDSRSYAGGKELKRERKMGVGSTVAGTYGLLGVNLEINLASDFGIILGYGISRGFGAINLAFRRTVGDGSFLPYFVAGYANWRSRSEGRVERTSPSVLKEKFLSGSEIQSGIYNEHIVYPGIGLQYVNRDGEWAGFGVYAEVLALLDLDDFRLGTTGGLGSVYYF